MSGGSGLAPEKVLRPVIVAIAGVGLVVAFAYLVWVGVGMIRDGGARAGLGAGLLLLTLVGAWSTYAIIRDGFALQAISRAASEAGCELDVSSLPRRPSGRIETASADELFARVSREYEADPGSWCAAYRLARAYDHAGDRTRARESMREAMRLRSTENDAGDAAR